MSKVNCIIYFLGIQSNSISDSPKISNIISEGVTSMDEIGRVLDLTEGIQ